MSGFPPAWKSFYDRALDYINERDLKEARWSAERSLYYVEKLVEPPARAKLQVFMVLQEIATLQGDEGAAANYAFQVRRFDGQRSLWQHIRDAQR
jgi:hypothetical protein